MTHDIRNKTRAVILAALMVVSVFGGTIAFAGTAAATANGVDFDGQSEVIVQTSDDITVNGDVTTDNTDVRVYIDANNNGTYDSGESAAVVDAGEISEGSFETTISPSVETTASGTTVYVHQSNSSLSDGASYSSAADESVGTLIVDDTPVSFNDDDIPEDGLYTTHTPEINQNVTDAISGVDDHTVQVTLRRNGDKYYSYEIGAQTVNDGVRYEDNYITIRPGDGEVPELVDGDYTATLSAADKAGNRNSTTLTFTVDTGAPTFSLNSPADGAVVGDTAQEISVEVFDSNVDSANLTITNESGEYSETFTRSSSGTFSVVPGTDTSAELPNGTITIDVNATDAAGNYAEASYSFEVDNIKPHVTDINLSSTEINTKNNAGSETLTAAFDEPVQPGTVEAIVSVDGTTVRLSDTVGSNDDNTVVDLRFDVSSYTATNDSSIVTVDKASDSVGNSLQNTANTTFSIDTQTPTISFSEIGDNDVISGYANITGGVTVDTSPAVDDVESVNYYLIPGGTGAIPAGFSKDDAVAVSEPKNIDTTDLPDGSHTLVVTATDNASNEVYNNKTLTIDNNEPSLSYNQDAVLTGEVDLSEFLTVNGADYGDSFTYEYSTDGGNSWTTATDGTININDLGEGTYKFRVTASDVGFEADNTDELTTVGVEGKKLSLDAFDISADGDTLTVSVTTDVELDRLNVSVATSDEFRMQSSDLLELDDGDFTQTESESGFTYVATSDQVSDLDSIVRDGQFTATFQNASVGEQYLETAATDSATIDTEDVSVTDADVVSADKDQLDVRVRFSEPVASDVAPESFGGHNVIVQSDEPAKRDGVVNYTIQGMAQTGGDKMLTITDLTEEFGTDTTDSTGADLTFSLDLSEGTNVVSVPAETGAVPIDSLNLDGVNSIWEYDDGEWAKHVVATGDGSLTELNGGLGYVITADEDTEVDYEVQNTPVPGVERNSESLETGWNLIGHYQEGSQDVDQAFIGLTGVWSVEDGYTGEQPQSLALEQGYWMNVNQDALHAPVSYDGPQSEQPEVFNTQIGDGTAVYDGYNLDMAFEVSHDQPIEEVRVISSDLNIDTQLTFASDATSYDSTGADAPVAVGQPTPEALSNGEAAVTIAVTDIYGNTQYVTKTVSVDNTAPSVSNVQINDDKDQNGVVADGDSVTITADVSDASPVSSVTADASGFGAGSVTLVDDGSGADQTSGDGTYTKTIVVDGTSTSDGDQSVTVSAMDANENGGSQATESGTLTVE
ncbi:hypothetical protein D3D02_17570 [Halobellus sp. Atlit-38R]|nr:hypothetical protein D3D02_17570 [Halobellus sp. Atlit-38R]